MLLTARHIFHFLSIPLIYVRTFFSKPNSNITTTDKTHTHTIYSAGCVAQSHLTRLTSLKRLVNMQHRQVVQRLWQGRLLNTTPLSLSHTHVEREIKTSITQYTCNDDVYELWMSCTIVCGEGGMGNAVPTDVSKRCHRLLLWVCISPYTHMYNIQCVHICMFFFFCLLLS